MFAYCENNPVIYRDDQGDSATIAGAVAGAFFGALDAAINGGSIDQVFGCAAVGAITGAMAGFAVDVSLATWGLATGVAVSAAACGLSSMANSALTQNLMSGEINIGKTIFDGAAESVFGSLGAATTTITKPIVNGIKNGILYAKNMINSEISSLATHTTNKITQGLLGDTAFALVTSFGNWFSGLFSSNWRRK